MAIFNELFSVCATSRGSVFKSKDWDRKLVEINHETKIFFFSSSLIHTSRIPFFAIHSHFDLFVSRFPQDIFNSLAFRRSPEILRCETRCEERFLFCLNEKKKYIYIKNPIDHTAVTENKTRKVKLVVTQLESCGFATLSRIRLSPSVKPLFGRYLQLLNFLFFIFF